MRKIGVLPAAGTGSRWGHYPKFLLPCGDREWLLDRAVRAFPCKQTAVICSEETFEPVRAHLARCGLLKNTIMLTQVEDWDIYGAMHAAMLNCEADYYYFAMPDTYTPLEAFKHFEGEFTLGVHYTTMPERYGMIRQGRVVNKKEGPPGLAWV